MTPSSLRGTGRTTRMMNEILDRGVPATVVVATHAQGKLLGQMWVSMGGDPKDITFVTSQEVVTGKALRGTNPRDIFWDHYAVEQLPTARDA